ncbi:hypothetical protein WICPIJ_004988 [Wickerhamomyces pijperi]|uniref:Uncharacterized protein n=1 Tax=Wickerhamomyces pijperi TaxID=599730 RepID=A0A9P8TME2_WICPI|nr:hypothetical protein WICPIJ_004988 [Wickerhamomyces pijperi]
MKFIGNIGGSVFQFESVWQLEIQLDSGTLMPSLQGVGDHDIDLWTVESTITWVNFPFDTGLVQSRFQLGFGLVPGFNFTNKLFWSGG